ncbi:MAG: radical SAM protein, partial [Candidatus Heimdallarchaeota archaeon]
MNILIVDALAANEGRRKFSRDAIGVGPRLLAGICQKNNIFSRIVRVEDFLEKEVKTENDEFEVYLLSAMTVDRIAVERAIKRIRQENNRSVIVLGGPILSDEEILNTIEADIGVKGEGEWILNDLLRFDFSVNSMMEEQTAKKYNIEKFDNSWYIRQIVKETSGLFENFTPSTERILDYPDYWFSKVYVETVRGCSNHYRGSLVKQQGGCLDCDNCDDPSTIIDGECPEDIPPGCGFCSVPATFGFPRSRNIDFIVDEVIELYNNGVKRIVLSAPGFLDFYRNKENKPLFSPTNPPANIERIEEILSKLAKVRDSQSNKCSISVENVKPSLVTEEVSEIFGKYIPGTAISIGCETFEEQHSNQIGRPSSPKDAIKAAKMLSAKGLHPQIYLIHSLPGETVQSLDYTREIVENKLDEFVEKITVYKYLPLPNSPFEKTKVESITKRHLLKIKREELKKAIIQFNLKKKRNLINSKVIAIAAERDVKR